MQLSSCEESLFRFRLTNKFSTSSVVHTLNGAYRDIGKGKGVLHRVRPQSYRKLKTMTMTTFKKVPRLRFLRLYEYTAESIFRCAIVSLLVGFSTRKDMHGRAQRATVRPQPKKINEENELTYIRVIHLRKGTTNQ